VKVVELVVAGLLSLGGIRSLVVWIGSEFDARSAREQVLYSLYLTARVGMWFAFAGFFAGYALVDEPQNFAWYVMIPISLVALIAAPAQEGRTRRRSRGLGEPPTGGWTSTGRMLHHW